MAGPQSVLAWQDPPEHRANAVFTRGVLEELRANPERWALIRRYRSSGSRRDVKHPVDIEVRWCCVERGAELYARAKQEGS